MMARAFLVALALGLGVSTPALADFSMVSSRADFERLIDGRELRRFGIRLTVSPEGEIIGRAFGGDVSGDWTWNDGYFCRDLFYAGDDLGYNCQMVQVHGDTLRFTTDRGEGIYADLRLR